MLMKVISGWGGVVFRWCFISRKISGSRCFNPIKPGLYENLLSLGGGPYGPPARKSQEHVRWA